MRDIDTGRLPVLGYGLSIRYLADNFQLTTSLTPNIDTGSQDLKTGLVVKEMTEQLLVTLRFSCSKGIATVGPYTLMRSLTGSTGLVYCPTYCKQTVGLSSKTPNSEQNGHEVRFLTVDGEGRLEKEIFNESAIIIRRLTRNILARCLSIYDRQDRMRGDHNGMLLRHSECMSCCIKAALDMPKPVVYHPVNVKLRYFGTSLHNAESF